MKKLLVLLSLLAVSCSSSNGNIRIIEACGSQDQTCNGYVSFYDAEKQPEKYIWIKEFRVEQPFVHHHHIYFVR